MAKREFKAGYDKFKEELWDSFDDYNNELGSCQKEEKWFELTLKLLELETLFEIDIQMGSLLYAIRLVERGGVPWKNVVDMIDKAWEFSVKYDEACEFLRSVRNSVAECDVSDWIRGIDNDIICDDYVCYFRIRIEMIDLGNMNHILELLKDSKLFVLFNKNPEDNDAFYIEVRCDIDDY